MPILPIPNETENRSYLNIINKAYQFMLDNNRNPHIARIENVPQELLTYFQENGFQATLKETEYLYETAALARLRGNRYKRQRHAYNGFVAQYPSAKLRPYTPMDQDACFALYDRWRETRSAKSEDLIYNAMLDDSRSAHRIGISHAEALGLVGRVVHIDRKISGYTFGYALNAGIFCVLFEIADLGIKGLAQFIYREFCRELMGIYRWINAMDEFRVRKPKARQKRLSSDSTDSIVQYRTARKYKKMRAALIFLNGYYDTRSLDFYCQEIRAALENDFPLICADGGIRIFDELNRGADISLVPDVLIGDMDSGAEAETKAKRTIQEWIGKTDKDYTDGQLAVDYALAEYGCRYIIIYGGLPRPEDYETESVPRQPKTDAVRTLSRASR